MLEQCTSSVRILVKVLLDVSAAKLNITLVDDNEKRTCVLYIYAEDTQHRDRRNTVTYEMK